MFTNVNLYGKIVKIYKDFKIKSFIKLNILENRRYKLT